MGKAPARKSKSGSRFGEAVLNLQFIELILAELDGQPTSGDLESAQEIMWDAWDAGSTRRRVALARKALKVSPLCTDAYVLLAQETARSVEEALQLYCQGVEAGEKSLGKDAFRDDVGHFWGILETRPYMRARQGLAASLWESGAREEAVAHYQDMLRLSPNDNQGIRYILLDCLLTVGSDEAVRKLLRRYRNDDTAAWAWSGTLALFRQQGDSPAARKALDQAVAVNPFVSAYLLGRKKLPRTLPAFIGMGDKDEAVAYVHDSAQAWGATPGALEWVKGMLA